MRKLHKSKNKIICGVCAGIGEYLDVDPTVIRILWVIGTLLSMGIGVVAYIVACILMPERN